MLRQDILVETGSREGVGSIADVRKSMAYLKHQLESSIGQGRGTDAGRVNREGKVAGREK
jgi:hypothetical protein